MQYLITCGVSTEKGNYRKYNEDNFLCNDIWMSSSKDNMSYGAESKIPMLFAICDGMGGSGHGREASFTAIKALQSEYKRFIESEHKDTASAVDHLIRYVNLRVTELKEKGFQTGCTLAMAYLSPDRIYLANIGDSRIYLYQEQKLTQLSVDHNQASEFRRMGFTGAGNDRGRHVLTQYLGISDKEMIIEPYYKTKEYGEMLLLLCSDGLTEALSEDDLTEIISGNKNTDLKAITEELIMKAIKKGATDNITAMLISIR